MKCLFTDGACTRVLVWVCAGIIQLISRLTLSRQSIDQDQEIKLYLRCSFLFFSFLGKPLNGLMHSAHSLSRCQQQSVLWHASKRSINRFQGFAEAPLLITEFTNNQSYSTTASFCALQFLQYSQLSLMSAPTSQKFRNNNRV